MTLEDTGAAKVVSAQRGFYILYTGPTWWISCKLAPRGGPAVNWPHVVEQPDTVVTIEIL